MGTSSPKTVYTKQQRIAELAGLDPGLRLTTLHHHMDMDWLLEAYRRTRKDGATGVDGVTAGDFAMDLEANLADLLTQAKSGRYRAPAVRRAYIPKGNGERRALGIPAFEDKVLQRAVAMLLEPIYEQDFLDCSYGFRPGRSAHQALVSIRSQTMAMGGCWLIDADISKYFDTLDKAQLRAMLDQRVGDGVVRRLIGKWLKAGVMEAGSVHYPDAGTPQGGVISPLLSNIYLHHVLDLWFDAEVKPRLRGRAFLVRYADDFVIGCEHEDDARRVLAVLPKRFARYGLSIHPDKTRLIRFYPPDGADGPKPGTFDFLGFTHHWDRSRRGRWCVRQRTMGSRFQRGLKRLRDYCRHARSEPIALQQHRLSAALRGHYGYYGITGNYARLQAFYHQACRAWQYWLKRRSNRRDLNWEQFNLLLVRHPLPLPRIVHRAALPANQPT